MFSYFADKMWIYTIFVYPCALEWYRCIDYYVNCIFHDNTPLQYIIFKFIYIFLQYITLER